MLLPLLLAAALAAEPAPSDPAARDRHLELAEAATRAERELRPDDAIALCRQAAEALPDGPRTDRCARRIAFLEARRDADGTFGGWVALERARAAFRERGAEATRADVAALVTREGLASAVRAEAVTWLASDDLDRRDDPGAALASTDALYAGRAALAPDVRRLLITVRARALARLGRVEEAKTVEDEIRVAAPAPRPTPVEREVGRAREGHRTTAAWTALAVFGLATLPAAPAGLRARPRPWGLVPLGLAVGGAWAVARVWGEAPHEALLSMGAGFAVVHVLTVLARRPDAGRAWRALVSLLAAAATLAVAWLALVNADALGWVGLG